MNKNEGYTKTILLLLGVWLLTVISASALGVFRSQPGKVSIPLVLAIALPLITFLTWFARSGNFRRFLFGLNPATLTIAHTWRLAGFLFIVLSTYGLLPKLFAYPAGFGDIAIGLTAPFAAKMLVKHRRHRLFTIWHALGILDLIAAVSTGILARILGAATSMALITILPLSLIPGFFVPLMLMLHVVSIAQATSWKEKGSAQSSSWHESPLLSRQS